MRSDVSGSTVNDPARILSIIEQFPSAAAVYEGPNLICIIASDRYRRMAGGRPLIGRPIREALPDFADQAFVARLERVLGTGETITNSRVPADWDDDGDGLPEAHFADFTYSALRDGKGRIWGVVVHVVDASDRVATEEAARRSEEELRTLADRLEVTLHAVQDGITVQAANGALVYANDAAARLCGFESAEAFLAAGREKIYSAFVLLDENGEPLSREMLPSSRALNGEVNPESLVRFRVVATGEERYSMLRSAGVRDASGAVKMVVNAFHDITERVRQQEELQARTAEAEWAEERSRYLAEASRVLATSLDYEAALAIVARLAVPRIADWCTLHLVDPTGEVRRLEVAHADPAKLAWAHQVETRYPPAPNDPRDGVNRVMRTGLSELYPDISDELLVAAARDEEHLHLLRLLQLRSAIVVPLKAQERVLGVMTLIAAESGHHYTQSDLALAEALADRAASAIDNARLLYEARDASQAKSNFLTTMSHEIRTPINAIIGYAELLDTGIGGKLAPQHEQFVSRIKLSSGHLLDLVNDVLDLAKIEAGHVAIAETVTSAADVVRAVIEVITPLAEERGLVVRPLRDTDEVVTFRGDEGRVRQILVNLLSNAIKFTDKGGTIGVTCNYADANADATPHALPPGGRWSCIHVADTGIGIAPELHGAIFQPFYQTESGLTRSRSGTGLGLAISQQLARLMGGDITLRSEYGEGATFTLWLPAE